MTTCKKCRDSIQQRSEKALNGDWALVWSDREGNWVCPSDGNEHDPVETPDQTSVQHGDVGAQDFEPEDGEKTWMDLEGLFAGDIDRLNALVDQGYGAQIVSDWVSQGGDYAGSDGASDRLDAWLAEQTASITTTDHLCDAECGDESHPRDGRVIPQGGWWVRLERDHGRQDMTIGPYPSEAYASHAMENAPLVEGECQENALECYTTDRPEPTDEYVLITMDDPTYTGLPPRYRVTVTSDNQPEPFEVEDPEDDYQLGERIAYILEARDGSATIEFERIPGVLPATTALNQHTIAFGETS